jgi:hypothetical protein
MLQKIIAAAYPAIIPILLLACAPGAPRSPVGRSFFIGTWHSSSQCLETIMFSDVHAEWQINYRTCISDTIQDPFAYVDSIFYDTVRDSFLIMDFKGWEASDSEIVFFDTVRMPGGVLSASRSTLEIDLQSAYQFYAVNGTDSARTLYTKQ